MKLHRWHAIGWGIITALFILWEVIGLANDEDEHQPFTFYVRKVAGSWTSPTWFLCLGFLVWLIVHFLFVHGRKKWNQSPHSS